MLCGVISKKNFAVNAISTVILILVMLKLCEDKGFCNIVILDFVLFISFIAIQDQLRISQDKINCILQGKTDKKLLFILKTVNRIVKFKILTRDKLYSSRVTELQNDNEELKNDNIELTEKNSQLSIENNNANRTILEKDAIIVYINDNKEASLSRIEHSINGVHATFIKGFRTIYSDVNSYKERELKENRLELEHKRDESRREYNTTSKQLKKAKDELQYTTEKNTILNRVQDKIRHHFEGKKRVSRVYIRTLVQVLCKDASISYSDRLSNEIYELLPSNLVLKGSGGGKPSQVVINATRELENQLKS